LFDRSWIVFAEKVVAVQQARETREKTAATNQASVAAAGKDSAGAATWPVDVESFPNPNRSSATSQQGNGCSYFSE
jgi:hypothetical protein